MYYRFLISHPEENGSIEITVEEDSEQAAWEAAFILFPSEEGYEVELSL